MQISTWVTVSDLMPTCQTIIEKAIGFFDKKRVMFRTLRHDYIFKCLKEAGVDGLELLIPFYASNKNIMQVKKIIVKNNIPILSIHQSLSNISSISLYKIRNLCEIASMFSAGIVVLHSGSLGKKLFNTDFAQALIRLQKKHNIIFGIENMSRTPLLTPEYTYKGASFSSVLMKSGLAMTFDTTHLAQTGEDIIKFYLANKKKIINIHLSDFRKDWLNTYLFFPNNTHIPLGEGILPISNFLKILKRERYKGLITMEINGNLTQLCDSAKFIRRYI